jgi:hypothetical protein
MPKEGLCRAGRWADIYEFPPPARPLSWASGPVYDGYRWEDIEGRFSTAKCSASAEGAVGRTIARYRERTVGGISLINSIKQFLIAEPDRGPAMTSNLVPRSYFDDAYLLQTPYDDDVEFIDLEHQRSRDALSEIAGDLLDTLGARIHNRITQHRDRRVTRAITTVFQGFCAQPDYAHVAGLRYATPDRLWNAYVLWNEPARIDLEEAEHVRPLLLDDDAVQAAAKILKLDLPKLD